VPMSDRPIPADAVTLHAPSSAGPVSQLIVVPSRGALVTHWQVGGRERLYLDESTLADPTKNVRGGIPLLFPSPGKLADGRFARAGKSGAMKQHGFARDLPWAVTRRSDASVSLALSSNDATRAVFAWDFAVALTLTLTAESIRLAVRVENTGKDPMPFGFGIHPYFPVHDKAHATISTAATRAFDNVTGKTGPFRGFDLAVGETDLHLIDHGSTDSTLAADGARVTLRTSPELGRWVVWTQPGKEFVCVEPWTAPGNALNTGEGLIELLPSAAKELWIELSASGPGSVA
jgi:galactose mutarotase-like enzyme